MAKNEKEEVGTSNGKSAFVPKKKIGFQQKFGEVTIREFEGIDCEGAPILVAFPTTISTILCAGYIREYLNLPLIGSLSSSQFPKRCVVENGLPMHPVRIFGDQKIVVILCEFQIPEDISNSVVESLFDFAERHHSKFMLTIEGIPTDLPSQAIEKQKKFSFISRNENIMQELLSQGHETLNNSVVPGISGLILAEGEFSRVEVVCFGVPAPKFPEASSTVTILKTLSKLLGVPIDTSTMEKKAHVLAQSVDKVISSSMDMPIHSQMMYS